VLPKFVNKPLMALAATKGGARAYRWLLPRLDRIVQRVTGGKRTFTSLVLPTFVLVTTGRRSGTLREQPLVHVAVDNGWAVVGTNWGQDHHPAWTHNLLADPSASVRVGGREVAVTARLLAGAERDGVYARFEALSPNYAAYKVWSGKDVRVFALERQA